MAPLLSHEGILVTDKKGKAEILNNSLNRSVFSKVSPLTPTQTSDQPQDPTLTTMGAQHPTVPQNTNMPDLKITDSWVAKLHINLQLHKAAGPDNIWPIILRTLYKEITPILLFFRIR